MLKVALIGCGKSADMHVGAIQRLACARLTGVCDVEPLMARQLAARYEVSNCYSDVDTLITSEKPDVLHIATPPESHYRLAVAALEANCHVVIEKPVGMNADEASRLIAEAEVRSRKLTIAYTYHLDPVARMLRDLVGRGVMGDPVHLESYFGYNLKGPFGIPILGDANHWVHKLPGKLFQNILDHVVNKVTDFLTEPAPNVLVHSWQSADNGTPRLGRDLPDELRVMMFGKKSSAYLTVSSHARPIRHSLLFRGTKNTALLDFNSSTIRLERDSILPGVLGRLSSPFSEGWQCFREGTRNVLRFVRSDYHFFSGFNYLVSKFYESIVKDLPVPISYKDILRNALILDQIVEQLHCATGRTS